MNVPGLQRDSNPWPPRYRCDALPTELWSHTLGARSGQFFRLLLSSCLNWKIYCDDHTSLSSTTAVQIWIISYILYKTKKKFHYFNHTTFQKLLSSDCWKRIFYSRVAIRVTQLFTFQRRILGKIYEKHRPRRATWNHLSRDIFWYPNRWVYI